MTWKFFELAGRPRVEDLWYRSYTFLSGKCKAGYFCREGAQSDQPEQDTQDPPRFGPCPAGHSCPEATAEPKPCPPGKYADDSEVSVLWKNCIILYYIVLYCIVMYYIILYCLELCCITLYCNVLYYIILYCIALYCIILYDIVL